LKVKNSQRNIDDNEVIQAKITNNISVFIQSVDQKFSLNQPVYAINWFNTRMLWLYNFYNLLAAISVNKVGGKPFFKGRVKKTLYGSDEFRRDILLIVNYPGANSFKNMLENTYFKIVSLLRMLAVKEFTFGFSRRTDLRNNKVSPCDNGAYAIVHYRGESNIDKKISLITVKMGIDICFSGRITSLLFSGNESEVKEQVPCLMEGVFVLKADTNLQLEKALSTDEFQTIIQQTISSFVATLERIF